MSVYVAPQVPEGPVDVFLAGGIANTYDWQAMTGERLSRRGLVVANPRRPGMFSDPSLEPGQVGWEHALLTRAEVVLFWFPGPGDHPIAMYELGYWSALGKDLVVGCPEGYRREVNIRTQMTLAPHPVEVLSTLDAVVDEAVRLVIARRDEKGE